MRVSLAVSLAFALVLLSGFQPVLAQATSNGTATWTIVGAPVPATVGVYSGVQVTYDNHVNASILGIVLFALRNSQGQLIYLGDGTITIGFNQFGTAYVVSDAPLGTYTASIFVISTAGVAMSNTTTMSYTQT